MKDKNYEVFNFGSGNGYSVIEVIKCFEKLLGKSIEHVMGKRRPGDLERLVAVSSKAEEMLQWKAERSLEDMCSSCIKFTVLLAESIQDTQQ